MKLNSPKLLFCERLYIFGLPLITALFFTTILLASHEVFAANLQFKLDWTPVTKDTEGNQITIKQYKIYLNDVVIDETTANTKTLEIPFASRLIFKVSAVSIEGFEGELSNPYVKLTQIPATVGDLKGVLVR